ncbi:hypothetical protein RDI58_026781 [Solanum bulbocastanum]|uniref:Uncharacterized protein n=1 Tax=Solanum bulbocastanum TaxID=147425 RepID=A0AAN8Y168_SOLBU
MAVEPTLSNDLQRLPFFLQIYLDSPSFLAGSKRLSYYGFTHIYEEGHRNLDHDFNTINIQPPTHQGAEFNFAAQVNNNVYSAQQENAVKDGKSKVKYNGSHPELAARLQKETLDTNPGVKCDDVAGLSEAKGILREIVVLPLLMPEYFQGIRRPWRGVLMFGPPVMGKTLLAKAVATDNNFPRSLDEALRRRLEKRIYIPFPDFKNRKELIRINLKSIELMGVDIEQVAQKIEGNSRDDLTNICRDASLNGMRWKIAGKTIDEIKNILKLEMLKILITMEDYLEAVDKIKPTVSSGTMT